MKLDQIRLILAVAVQSVSTFDCYVGSESSFEAKSCFSCQSVACLCMSATPVTQYANSKYDNREELVFSSLRNSEERTVARLPTYSDSFLEGRQLYSNEHPDNQRPGYVQQLSYQPVPQRTPRPRIVFPSDSPESQEVLRECWPNPYQAESPGCTVQRYRGQWYNICRCGTELCNAAPLRTGQFLLGLTTTVILLFLLS